MVTQNGMKGVKDVLGDGKISFYPDLERIDKVQLLATNFVIHAAKLVSDWDSEFGLSSFFLVKVEAEGKYYTTILSGQALTKQLRKLVDGHKLPVAASLKVVKSDKGNEYYLLDNPASEAK